MAKELIQSEIQLVIDYLLTQEHKWSDDVRHYHIIQQEYAV